MRNRTHQHITFMSLLAICVVMLTACNDKNDEKKTSEHEMGYVTKTQPVIDIDFENDDVLVMSASRIYKINKGNITFYKTSDEHSDIKLDMKERKNNTHPKIRDAEVHLSKKDLKKTQDKYQKETGKKLNVKQ